ncbi:hypothetical protein [Mammaliicoccus sciuri]|uniref:hypothetical protein n=1 Tax=Mammaliicoccus sciuri TaxID=1296 RepID=UPI001E60CBB7|nr:hypothetical protein [Mammaliicoccus sciuri]MCD8770811.1 hypothetical protein [Mammaliicoccus sciuri]
MITCYKTFITEDGKIKKYSTGQVILEDMNITYQEIKKYINKADRVEKFICGIKLYFDDKEKYSITIKTLYNVTTKKRESAQEYINRLFNINSQLTSF